MLKNGALRANNEILYQLAIGEGSGGSCLLYTSDAADDIGQV